MHRPDPEIRPVRARARGTMDVVSSSTIIIT
jgi:hypothetical protein